MGAKQQEIGAGFERYLCALHERLVQLGKARVKRVKPPMNVLGVIGKGVFKTVYSGEDCVDFEGTLRGGRAVVFDAKQTAGEDRFDFGLIRDGQLRELREQARFGALAFLLVRRPVEGRAARDYVVPVDADGRIAGVAHKRSLALLSNATRESVRWEELEIDGWMTQPGESWVEVVERQVASGRWWPLT